METGGFVEINLESVSTAASACALAIARKTAARELCSANDGGNAPQLVIT